MELTKLINSLKVIQVSGQVERKDVEYITYDSRKVKKNSIFVAITGYRTDGHKFIFDAINKGAAAVIIENNNVIPDEVFIHQNVTKILVADSRKALAQVSNIFYKEPSKKLYLVGITGTKGKTTTSYFIKNIFETAGFKTGLIGTIANYIGDRQIYTELTTPESSDLNVLFTEMLSEGCSHAVMEVSSHSLVLNRVNSIEFKAGIFTNITSDHLDFHLNFDEYLKAKKILFDSLNEKAVILLNNDDDNSVKLISDSTGRYITYGKKAGSVFQLKDIKYDLEGTRFNIDYLGKNYHFSTRLIGEFNAYNAAAAFAVCILSGIDIETAIKGISSTPQVPGRFETIHALSKTDKNKKVIVDYSHTADSLEKALLAIHSILESENVMRPVYTVFGCGGNRDRTKRPVMGKIASDLSTKAIVTSDNPRFEEPLAIIDEIIKGISKNNYEVIENREEAIKSAVKNSEDNAVILIAGKGHENYQEIKGARNHFSDKEIAEKYLLNE